MTIISASTVTYSSVTVKKDTSASAQSDLSFLDMLNKSESSASSQNNILSGAINISDPRLASLTSSSSSDTVDALAALGTSSKSPADSFNDLLASLTGSKTTTKTTGSTDDLMNYIQKILAGMDNSLGDMLSPSTDSANSSDKFTSPIDSLSSSGKSAVDMFSATDPEFLTGAGPLPTFMHAMDVQLKLTPQQQLALRVIAEQNKDIVKTPESVKKLGEQLAAAGIGHNNEGISV